MDWNWFFSSLAQSAAAVVGLLGAFVVTKIVNNEVVFRQKVNRLSELLGESERFEGRARIRYFEWYNDRSKDDDLKRLRKLLRDERPNFRTSAEYYDEVGFSPFIRREELLDEIERELDYARRPPPPARDISSMPIIADYTFEAKLREDVRAERELIDALIVDLRAHVRLVQSFGTELTGNPESSKLINATIIAVQVLFLTSVIYPLSFLPVVGAPQVDASVANIIAHVLSLRGMLLLITGFIFAVLLGLFAHANRSLRYPTESVAALQGLGTLGRYSEFLRIMELNEQATTSSSTSH